MRKQRLQSPSPQDLEAEPTWQTVDLDSVKSEDVRTVGAETVAAWAYEKLHMSHILKKCGFHEADIDRAKVLILGKLMPAWPRKPIFK